MKKRRWLAFLLVWTVLVGLAGGAARAQYAEGLPPGVVAAEVDGQPIDAANSPTTSDPSPPISGRINTGVAAVDLAIGDGEIVRFTLEVDGRGRFRGQPPAPLAPGVYTLYIFDALVGSFTIQDGGTAGANGNERERGGGTPDLDIARVVPFPADFGDQIPGLGLLDGRFYTIDDEALRIASADGEPTREDIDQTRQGLRDNGWRSRYEARLAVPDPNDPTRFQIQVSSFVIVYANAEAAQAAFAASVAGADVLPGATIGDESELILLTGTTPDTGVTYQALRLLWRQDNLLGMTILADLLGNAPDQAVLEAAVQAVAARAEAVLAAQTDPLSIKALRLDLRDPTGIAFDEAYEVIDGVLAPLYDEDDALRQAREEAFAGTFDVYAGSATGVAGARRERDAATPGPAPAAARRAFAYATTVYAFPTPEDADAWLAGLGDRIERDPLRGYLSFAGVADAPLFGDGSATYAFQRPIGDATGAGFRVYVRVGSEVAAVEFGAAPEATLDEVAALVEAQIACLQAGACAGAAAFPGDVPRAADGEERDRARDRQDAGGQGGGVRDVGAPADAGEPAGVSDAPVETPAASDAATEPPRGGVVDVVPTEGAE